jgi:hypothetical protein
VGSTNSVIKMAIMKKDVVKVNIVPKLTGNFGVCWFCFESIDGLETRELRSKGETGSGKNKETHKGEGKTERMDGKVESLLKRKEKRKQETERRCWFYINAEEMGSKATWVAAITAGRPWPRPGQARC